MASKYDDIISSQSKKIEVDKWKIENDYERMVSAQKKQKAIENFSVESIVAEAESPGHQKKLLLEIVQRRTLLKQKLMFVNDRLSEMCPLCPGGIYLIGAISGTGKSTTAAAVAQALYEQGKKTFIISNEEKKVQVLERVACADLGIDFNAHVTGNIPGSIAKQVAGKLGDVQKYVHVADDSELTTNIDAVMKLIREVDDRGEHAVTIIDFVQRITHSSIAGTIDKWRLLDMLKDELTNYAQHAKTPVIVFAQLHHIEHTEVERNVENRLKGFRGLYEMCSSVIELIRIPGHNISIFHIDKARFGRAHISLPCEFVYGKFVPLTKAEMLKLKKETQLKQAEATLAELKMSED